MLYISKIHRKKTLLICYFFPKHSNALAKSKRTVFPMHPIIAMRSSVKNLGTTVDSKICFEVCLFLAIIVDKYFWYLIHPRFCIDNLILWRNSIQTVRRQTLQCVLACVVLWLHLIFFMTLYCLK